MIRNLLLAGLLGWSALGFAADGGAGEAADEGGMTIEEFVASLDFRAGVVNLPGGIARIDLGDGFRYLSPEDAERVLVAWGNPPGNESQGMLVPTGSDLFDDSGWAVIISYEEDGYVSDEDADKIDYAELLSDMQADTAAENEGRVQAGYEPIELVGWAAPPHYDRATHKLYWAKELAFGDAEQHTLNYNIRVLGRKGVLLLNAVAGMSQLAPVETGMQQVLAITEFNEGHRYADFDPDVDKVAAYGIGALVAGKLAAKAGLLAKLGVLLVAMKKFIVLIVIAVAGLVSRLFKRKPAEA
ncbi:MAG: DUF2167 domain-containing protein [Gammaproteobacteria bacterium]|nr:DUF2167 domain-containing protein [Gammaproteobacteria bacterium]